MVAARWRNFGSTSSRMSGLLEHRLRNRTESPPPAPPRKNGEGSPEAASILLSIRATARGDGTRIASLLKLPRFNPVARGAGVSTERVEPVLLDDMQEFNAAQGRLALDTFPLAHGVHRHIGEARAACVSAFAAQLAEVTGKRPIG